jgi:hypothetical protein
MNMERKYRARAQVDHSQLGESSKGTPRVEVAFNFLDEHGEGIVYMGYLTKGSIERTVKDLRTMGWKGNDPGDLSGIDANEVELVVDDEEYNGKRYDKVKWVNPIKTALDASKLAAKRTELAKRIAELEIDEKEDPEPKPKKSNVKKSNVADSDEDIPF